MSLFAIDEEKCRHDGICVRECPAQVITIAEGAIPVPVENAAEFCINCGHCVAVCPHDAFTLESMREELCPPVKKDLHPQAAQVKHLLMERRSVREYKKESVPREILEDLLDTARYAPTGSNKQQVHWTVFENPVEVRQLAALVVDGIRLMLPETNDEYLSVRMKRIVAAWDQGKDRILRGAPHLIMVHAPAELPSADTDCIIALTYLELYAYARGLGTCWAGYFTTAANLYPPLTAALHLPPGHNCSGAVMIGYPQYKYWRIPQRNAPQVTWR
jgi:nitroreductase/NAD-dependent dihydropyrimidine dehydrogenase PreA subunit